MCALYSYSSFLYSLLFLARDRNIVLYITNKFSRNPVNLTHSVDKKNQLDVTFCILYVSSNSCSTPFGQPCAHHQEFTTA